MLIMWANPYSYKIVDQSCIIESLSKRDRPIALAAGCFDLLHPGHIRLFLQIRSYYPDYLSVVALWGDEQIQDVKGVTRPYYSENIRSEILSALDCVDYIVVYHEKMPIILIEGLKPELYIKSDNYKIEQIPEASVVEANGGKVELLPSFDDWSTTRVVSMVRRK